jgi:hypothetical protein
MLETGNTVIVGNGASLSKARKGRVIDGYANVIRINDYVTDGYENHVGRKTTHWFSGAGKLATYKGRDITGIDVRILIPARYWKPKSNEYKVKEYLQINPKDVTIIDKKLADKILKIANKNGIEYPSTGMQAIIWLACIIGCVPDIIGFDCYQNKNANTHYFDNNNPETAFTAHAWDKEKDMIKNLEKHGRLKQI